MEAVLPAGQPVSEEKPGRSRSLEQDQTCGARSAGGGSRIADLFGGDGRHPHGPDGRHALGAFPEIRNLHSGPCQSQRHLRRSHPPARSKTDHSRFILEFGIPPVPGIGRKAGRGPEVRSASCRAVHAGQEAWHPSCRNPRSDSGNEVGLASRPDSFRLHRVGGRLPGEGHPEPSCHLRPLRAAICLPECRQKALCAAPSLRSFIPGGPHGNEPPR